MGAVSWFIGSLLFFVLVIGFTGAMGQEIAEADIGTGSVSSSISTNSSGVIAGVDNTVSFVSGIGIAWSESPVIVSTLLLIPLIAMILSIYLIVIRGQS